MTPTTDIYVIDAMTENEARAEVSAINGAAADIGRRLLHLREREGWRALGYGSFTAMLAGEFRMVRSWLYTLMDAAPVQERLSSIPDMPPVSASAAAALSEYEPELQAPIARVALARFGRITASRIRQAGEPIATAVRTGYAYDESGSPTPLEAALTAEQHEGVARQKQHIADSQKPRELVAVLHATVYDYKASHSDAPGVVAFRADALDVDELVRVANERAPLLVKVYRESET